LKLLGLQDANLKAIARHFNAKVTVRGGEIILKGPHEEVERLERLFGELILITGRTEGVTPRDVETVIELVKSDETFEEEEERRPESVILYGKGDFVRPKTRGQELYWRAVRRNDLVFVIGPAGTGKTYLAVAFALASLRDHEVDRIVLARPAVEAGESLGFLPGDYREKVDPYLRPLYDALYEMLPAEKLKRLLESRVIEVVPLAYMRGRTLNSAFVILDEAQNTSPNQMKMFLTRLGVHSKAIITGDITQIDLPVKTLSGLVQVQGILRDIDGIEFVYLTEHDVVRHRLVKEIIKAYDVYEGQQKNDLEIHGKT